MIPSFPEFQGLEAIDRSDYERVVSRFPPYSDFNFVSLWTWNLSGTTAASMLGDNLVIRADDYLTSRPYLSLLGRDDVESAVEQLMVHSEAAEGLGGLKRVPEVSVASMNGSIGLRFSAREDPANSDYVLRVSDLIEMPGGRFESRRRGVRRFRERHPEHTVCALSLESPVAREEIEGLLERWWTPRAPSKGSARRDGDALRRCLELSLASELVTVGVRVEGTLVGFTVNEVVHDDFFMAHYVRTLSGYRGLSELLEHETAKVMGALGCRWMNYQEDLGIPGLRAWKSSWGPVDFLRKYDLTWVEVAGHA